ncbi:hypothetical protein [Myxococcus phage Mx1]|nr:hypothetical protein [Myxococcus phage Mx1]
MNLLCLEFSEPVDAESYPVVVLADRVWRRVDGYEYFWSVTDPEDTFRTRVWKSPAGNWCMYGAMPGQPLTIFAFRRVNIL